MNLPSDTFVKLLKSLKRQTQRTNPRSGVTTAGQTYAPGRVFLIIFKKYMLVSVSVSTTVFGTVFTVYQIIYLA